MEITEKVLALDTLEGMISSYLRSRKARATLSAVSGQAKAREIAEQRMTKSTREP